MFKKIVSVAATVLFLSQSAFASAPPVDVTNEFVSYVSARFVGLQSSADKRYDYRNHGVGKIVYGQGSGTVSQLAQVTGKGFRYMYQDDIWGNPTSTVALGVDSSFIFNYEGSTTGRAQCYDLISNWGCGYEWGELHPQGRIILDVNADNNNGYIITVRYEVISDDDGRPSEVVRLAMDQLKSKAVDIVTTFAKRYKDNVSFVVK